MRGFVQSGDFNLRSFDAQTLAFLMGKRDRGLGRKGLCEGEEGPQTGCRFCRSTELAVSGNWGRNCIN